VQRTIDRLEGMRCGGKYPSVEQAFAALQSGGKPDVILLDVQLPGMDGITALSHLKSMAPDAQVVILTVFDDADKIFRAVCAGASGYILKSSTSAEIGEAIRQVVDGGAPMTPKLRSKNLFKKPKTVAQNEPIFRNPADLSGHTRRFPNDSVVKKPLKAWGFLYKPRHGAAGRI